MSLPEERSDHYYKEKTSEFGIKTMNTRKVLQKDSLIQRLKTISPDIKNKNILPIKDRNVKEMIKVQLKEDKTYRHVSGSPRRQRILFNHSQRNAEKNLSNIHNGQGCSIGKNYAAAVKNSNNGARQSNNNSFLHQYIPN